MNGASSSQPAPVSGASHPAAPRRGFFGKAGAIVFGTAAVFAPLVAGIAAYLDPLSHKNSKGRFLRVAQLDAVPANGTPTRFQVVADRRDAWNYYAAEPIGAVFIRRVSGDELEVLSDICPHLGCRVGFVAPRDIYQCPCHTSAFSIDGKVNSGPSPRALDTLEYRIEGTGKDASVWVKFQEFYTGRTAKVAKT